MGLHPVGFCGGSDGIWAWIQWDLGQKGHILGENWEDPNGSLREGSSSQSSLVHPKPEVFIDGSWRFPEISSYSRDVSSTGQKFSLLILFVFGLKGLGRGSLGSGSSGMLEPELDADSTVITGVWKLQGS